MEEKKVEKLLAETLEKRRGQLEKVGIIDNPDYDEELASIGKEEEKKEETKNKEGKEQQTTLK